MTKYLIAFMMICGVCWGEEINGVNPSTEWENSIDKNNPDELAIYESGKNVVNATHQLQKCDMVIVRQLNRLENRLKNMEDAQNKIFSMVADLEEKFMGIDRMEQISMPEIHANKLAAKMKREPNWNGKGKL